MVTVKGRSNNVLSTSSGNLKTVNAEIDLTAYWGINQLFINISSLFSSGLFVLEECLCGTMTKAGSVPVHVQGSLTFS